MQSTLEEAYPRSSLPAPCDRQHVSPSGTICHPTLAERGGSTTRTTAPHGGSSSASQNKPAGPRYRRPGYKRTTSGCLTCRRRRKKCDEAKPVCNNCRHNQVECFLPANGRSGKGALFSRFRAMAHASPSEQGRTRSFSQECQSTKPSIEAIAIPDASTVFQPRPAIKAHPVFGRQVVDIESSYRLEAHPLKQPAASKSSQQGQTVVEMSSTSHLDTEQTRYPDSSCSSDSQYGMLSRSAATPPMPRSLSLDLDLQSIYGVRAVFDALPKIEHFLVRLSEQLGTDPPCTPGLHGIFDQLGDKLYEKKRLIKKAA